MRCIAKMEACSHSIDRAYESPIVRNRHANINRGKHLGNSDLRPVQYQWRRLVFDLCSLGDSSSSIACIFHDISKSGEQQPFAINTGFHGSVDHERTSYSLQIIQDSGQKTDDHRMEVSLRQRIRLITWLVSISSFESCVLLSVALV